MEPAKALRSPAFELSDSVERLQLRERGHISAHRRTPVTGMRCEGNGQTAGRIIVQSIAGALGQDQGGPDSSLARINILLLKRSGHANDNMARVGSSY